MVSLLLGSIFLMMKKGTTNVISARRFENSKLNYVEFKRLDNIRKSNDTKNLGSITISLFGF